MSQNWGMGFIPCLILSCVALCFNQGWILAIVIWAIYLYECVKGEAKNQKEKSYMKLQEDIYNNTMKYVLRDFEKQLVIGQIMVELMNTGAYPPDHCKMMANSIVLRYCPIYLGLYCLELERQMPNATSIKIRELGLQQVKEKYLEDVEKNQKIMYSPESPYNGDSG